MTPPPAPMLPALPVKAPAVPELLLPPVLLMLAPPVSPISPVVVVVVVMPVVVVLPPVSSVPPLLPEVFESVLTRPPHATASASHAPRLASLDKVEEGVSEVMSVLHSTSLPTQR